LTLKFHILAGVEFLFPTFAVRMKKLLFVFFLVVSLFATSIDATAQCSICTRTAEQLGEKPAKGLNSGIIYLALTPLAIIGFIGFRWWRRNNSSFD
jgi:hypothetical protein